MAAMKAMKKPAAAAGEAKAAMKAMKAKKSAAMKATKKAASSAKVKAKKAMQKSMKAMCDKAVQTEITGGIPMTPLSTVLRLPSFAPPVPGPRFEFPGVVVPVAVVPPVPFIKKEPKREPTEGGFP
jgi:hypothetical protein